MPNFSFESTPDGLALKSNLQSLPGVLLLDYLHGNLGYRLTPERVLHEPLAKVIDHQAFVIDATGGLGKDSLMMAMMGCKVWMCEAHPFLYPLIQDAIQRALIDPYFNLLFTHPDKFQFFPEDAKNILEKFLGTEKAQRPDIVYLDPMFPLRKKSSLVKKNMQWLKAIHQEALTEYFMPLTPEKDLFQLSLQVATKRVVVKRPAHAPNLVPLPAPNFSKSFQSGRFDVYLC